MPVSRLNQIQCRGPLYLYLLYALTHHLTQEVQEEQVQVEEVESTWPRVVAYLRAVAFLKTRLRKVLNTLPLSLDFVVNSREEQCCGSGSGRIQTFLVGSRSKHKKS